MAPSGRLSRTRTTRHVRVTRRSTCSGSCGATRRGRAEHGLGFSVRMGLSSGEVVVGKIGDGLHGTAVYNLVRMRNLAAGDNNEMDLPRRK